jgi:hypothetical protein
MSQFIAILNRIKLKRLDLHDENSAAACERAINELDVFHTPVQK